MVTGGAGYIGSHTAKALAATGSLPVVFDDLSCGHRELVRFGPLVVGDINDAQALDGALSEHPVDGVIHLAARIDAAESIRHPDLYHRTNVDGTRALLDAMARHGIRAIVFSSSAAVYGAPDSPAVRETAASRPVTPYGQSKEAAESLLRAFAASAGLRWMALRIFNAAGADADGALGELHQPETHAIPLAIGAALGGTPFRVFGTDYATPDGTAVRDYVHVADLAQAHVAALRALADGQPSGAFNLGSGSGTSVREIITGVEQISGRTVPHTVSGRRAGDVAELVANNSRARQSLKWRPERSLSTIIQSAYAWHARRAARNLAQLPAQPLR